MHKLLPRSLVWLGAVVAAAGGLSSLTLLDFTAGYFIPVARMLSIVWMFGLAWKLPEALPVKEATALVRIGEPQL
jgi:hypothetical protein